MSHSSLPAMDHEYLSSIEDILEDARHGRMFILVDAENRENEGDLVIPAQAITPDVINFMAKHGRGLICLALTQERAKKLGLSLMNPQNTSGFRTAFTQSIEAVSGVTTGISAQDRARTISVAIDSHASADDLTSPGHVFPLIAQSGGVLTRMGHTEAAVDIARLAGQDPSGIICEIMNQDGTMARMPDLIAFAQFHGLKMATIASLMDYRLRTETFVIHVAHKPFPLKGKEGWHMHLFQEMVGEKGEHLALTYGDVTGSDPIWTHIASQDPLHSFQDMDAWGDAISEIEGRGKGLLILTRPTPYPTLQERLSLSHTLPITERETQIARQMLHILRRGSAEMA